jgi:hypothetical protein
MSPEAWSELSTHIGNPGTGQSFSFSEIDRLLHPTEEDLDAGRVGLHPDSPAAQLLEMALQKSHLVAVSKTPGYNPNFTVKVVAEEPNGRDKRFLRRPPVVPSPWYTTSRAGQLPE